MSVVTGIMLILGAGDWGAEPLREVQEWIAENYHDQQLKDVSDHAGGGKHPQFEAWAAGINYFDEDAFIEYAMSREWLHPEAMVLIVQPEDGTSRVFRPSALAKARNREAVTPPGGGFLLIPAAPCRRYATG
jgi:hypothetical protein